MNILKKITIIFVAIFITSSVCSGGAIISSVGKKIPETQIIFKSIIEEKAEQLHELEREVEALKNEKDVALKSVVIDIKENDTKRRVVDQELARDPQDDFLIKQSSLLTENHDVLHDLVRIWEGLPKKITDRIALLDKFLKDPELKNYAKELKISAGPYFFEDLENVHQKLINQQKFVDQIKKRKEGLLKEQKNLQQLLDKFVEEYKDRVAKQEEFSKSSDSSSVKAPFGLNLQQRALLVKLEVMLYRLRKDFVELQLKEKRYEIGLVSDELFLESRQLEILQDIYRSIKTSLTVTPDQIESALQDLERKKHTFSALKTKYNEEILSIRRLRDEEGAKLAELSVRYGIALGNDLNTWNIEPKKTVDSYKALCEVGLLNTSVQLLDDREAYFVAMIALEQEKINHAEGILRIKESYYKIISRKFGAEDEITQEIKYYTSQLSAYEASLKSYKIKKDEAEELLVKLQHETSQGLKKRKAEIQKLKDSLFRTNLSDYALCLRALDQAEENLSFRMEVVSGTVKVDTEVLAILDKIMSQSKFILSELESITIWYRPENAITWEGLNNVLSDIKMFFMDVKNYFMQFDCCNIVDRLKEAIKSPGALIWFLVKLLFVSSILLGIRRYSGFIPSVFMAIGSQYKFLYLLMLICAYLATFVASYAMQILGWVVLWLLAGYSTMPDPYLYIIFYLLSIPWLLYLAYQALTLFTEFNEKNSYGIIRQDSQKRFVVTLSIILYSSIVLFAFRQAFVLIKFPKSELPVILLTLNILIIQITLLLQYVFKAFINLIPLKYAWGERIYKFVMQYYYPILGLIIMVFVLSNPYVGYGRLVAYLVSGLILSTVLIKVLHMGHLLIKKGASELFFFSQDDVVKERFSHAKTWFGIAIVGSFALLGIIGSLLAAKIWGWPIGLNDIVRWLNQPLLGLGKGTSHPLTILTMGTFFLFIVSGLIVAYCVNRFVLAKIFDLMLVDAGMQNAITSLIRYLIVAAAMVLGLQSVGYGGLITYLYVLILGIGYLFQGLLNDLIAYFVILLQRPIKVGDYIKVDDQVMGLVRKITPKSVVLRHRNSTTFVVPNTQIINKPVVNWNYTRNFIGLDDIYITIGYEQDPAFVKELLVKVVENNPKVLKNPRFVIRLNDFKDHGYQFMVRAYVSSNFTLEMHDIASEIRFAIAKILREHAIRFAVPVRQIVSHEVVKETQEVSQ
jgi:small-conductance mechanosensitive channel